MSVLSASGYVRVHFSVSFKVLSSSVVACSVSVNFLRSPAVRSDVSSARPPGGGGDPSMGRWGSSIGIVDAGGFFLRTSPVKCAISFVSCSTGRSLGCRPSELRPVTLVTLGRASG